MTDNKKDFFDYANQLLDFIIPDIKTNNPFIVIPHFFWSLVVIFIYSVINLFASTLLILWALIYGAFTTLYETFFKKD